MTAAASKRILGTCQRDRRRGPEDPNPDADPEERSPPMPTSQIFTHRAAELHWRDLRAAAAHS
jgi:hypothetical protein